MCRLTSGTAFPRVPVPGTEVVAKAFEQRERSILRMV